MKDVELIGRRFRARDKGRFRHWGVITEIKGDVVGVFNMKNPEGYMKRTESLKDIKKWISEGLLK